MLLFPQFRAGQVTAIFSPGPTGLKLADFTSSSSLTLSLRSASACHCEGGLQLDQLGHRAMSYHIYSAVLFSGSLGRQE